MEYKNYKWKFANSITIVMGIIFFITFVIMSALLAVIGEYKSIPLLVAIVILLVPIYLIFLILGNHLYKKTSIKITEEGIHQNKRLLRFNNIRGARIGRFFKVFYFQIDPKKDGIFVSKKILLYFYSLEEVCQFVVSYNFISLLNNADYNLVVSFMQSVMDVAEEDLDPYFIKIFDNYKTTCDCCGNKTVFRETINSICPVCFWEQDKDIIYNPNSISDVNHISLSEAKINYEKYGACLDEFKDKVRKPYNYEKE